jgi:thioredoxin-dependent peroxiredoxin
MAEITFRGNPIHTVGDLPAVGSPAPEFTVTGSDLSDVSLGDFAGQNLVLSIFPSIDTQVCATSVRTFNERAAALEGTTVLNVSADLPFALGRFCGAEGIDKVKTASTFRSDFGDTYGVKIGEGPLSGLMSRAVVVIDGDGVVTYTEQVPEIGQEPDYESVIGNLKK